MAYARHSDKPAVIDRKLPKDGRAPSPSSTQGGPPLLQNGLELLRSSDC